MATKQIDISKYSVGEFSYILNSYIEESFTDVKIQYMMMERNNIVDGPFSLFNEADNNAAKNGILEKIKTIVRNVLNAIASIFEKIGDAIRNIISKISSLRVRRVLMIGIRSLSMRLMIKLFLKSLRIMLQNGEMLEFYLNI